LPPQSSGDAQEWDNGGFTENHTALWLLATLKPFCQFITGMTPYLALRPPATRAYAFAAGTFS